jgi:hypothetical protein
MQTDQQQNDEHVLNELNAWVRSLHATEGDHGWQHFAKPLSAAIVSARHSLFKRAGFSFEYLDSPDYGKIWIGNHDLVMVEFSPAREHMQIHMVLAYHRNNWRGGGIWINGRAIDVPCDDNGFPLSDYSGQWIDDDTFQVQVGFPDHPLTDWSIRDQLSELRGLLFVDAKTDKKMLVLPHDDECWSLPRTQCNGKRIHIYADEDAMTFNRIARTVEF